MAHLCALCTLLTCLVFYLSYSCEGSRLPCKCLGPECNLLNVDPEDCMYGHSLDFCGRRVCSKGPDMRCGGRYNIMGSCGLGMQCNKCDRCSGCSLHTLECSEKLCGTYDKE